MRIMVLRNSRPFGFAARLSRLIREQGHTARVVMPDQVPRFPVRTWDGIVNYGCARTPEWWEGVQHIPDRAVLGSPSCSEQSGNKVTMFQAMSALEIPTVPYTFDRAVAREWVQEARVFVRQVIRGHGGAGIEVMERNSPAMPRAPLYTKAVRGRNIREYRAYIVGGRVVHWARKARRNGTERTPEQDLVRVHNNGWVFVFNDLRLHDEAASQVRRWAGDLELSMRMGFGCIDFLADMETGEAWMLETNTAPGLRAPTTCDKIVPAIINHLEEVYQ